jgi:hypothetical protein
MNSNHTLLLLLAFLAAQPAAAATVIVTSTADNGAGTLRSALASAANGDTIAFSIAGTITLTSGELLVTKNLNILGPGPANLAVDGNAANRVFHIAPSNTVTITGLTITNGEASKSPPLGILAGDGIYNDHATLTVSNCTVSGGSASYLGAIFNHGSGSGSASLTIINSTVSGNNGGGIYNAGGFGGSATLRMTNSTLARNPTGSYGGGIVNDGNSGSADAVLVNSTVRGNSADSYGGGIFNEGYRGSASLLIINCTLSGNSSSEGGGIYNHGPFGNAMLQICQSTLSGNRANAQGGGIFNDAGNLFIQNSTLSSNFAGQGGGILNHDGFVEIGSTILHAGASGENIYGEVRSDGFNLSTDDGGGFLTAPGDKIYTDPKLGPLQNNGGPTFTHALLGGSPAIDQGRSFTASATDQRGTGFARTVDDPAVANATGGDGTDIGAFEVQPEVPPAEQIGNLIELVQGLGLHSGIANSLIVKLQAAARALDRGNTQAACDNLGSFLNEVNAQNGKKLAAGLGGLLAAEAMRIRTGLNCF